MGTALAIAGWLAFGAAAAAAGLVRHTLAARAEAVARACHEVRGSLTAARLGLEWGTASQAAPGSRLRAIELELDRAAAALDDLQHVDRYGPEESATNTVDVEAWLSDAVEAFRPLAMAVEMELCLQWLGPPAQVRGRRARLAQASDNLIANAIEHGGSPIQVWGQVHERMVRIEVADGGPGFPNALNGLLAGRGLRRRRCRGRRSVSRHRGRGLVIARDVAAEHGGTLTAGSGGEGASLVLELPLAE
jgi:signal transduction histidine kinase